jgi:predicted ABC-type ATPase
VLPLLHTGVAFINADEIQRAGSDGPVAAAREFLRRLDIAAGVRQSFALETTLASRTYLPRIGRWRAAGFRTVLHFIEVPSADLAVSRVAKRVASGGHPIPEADIRRRFERGRQLFDEVYKGTVHEWHHWQSDDQGLRFLTSFDPADA